MLTIVDCAYEYNTNITPSDACKKNASLDLVNTRCHAHVIVPLLPHVASVTLILVELSRS